jgi:GGDEF domain-containing protein
LDHVSDLRNAETVAEILKATLKEPINLMDRPYYASASIGAAIYPSDGSTHTSLHAMADERMYGDKDPYPVATER